MRHHKVVLPLSLKFDSKQVLCNQLTDLVALKLNTWYSIIGPMNVIHHCVFYYNMSSMASARPYLQAIKAIKALGQPLIHINSVTTCRAIVIVS